MTPFTSVNVVFGQNDSASRQPTPTKYTHSSTLSCTLCTSGVHPEYALVSDGVTASPCANLGETVCIWGHSPAPTWLSNWDERLCPCSHCIPPDMKRMPAPSTWWLRPHKRTAPFTDYRCQLLCEWGLKFMNWNCLDFWIAWFFCKSAKSTCIFSGDAMSS